MTDVLQQPGMGMMLGAVGLCVGVWWLMLRLVDDDGDDLTWTLVLTGAHCGLWVGYVLALVGSR